MSKKRVISHYDFVRDLGRGAIGEDIAEAFFSREFGVVAANKSKRNPDYDLLIEAMEPSVVKKKKVAVSKLLKEAFNKLGCKTNKNITVEVKFDEAAARYSNFFIELFFDIDSGVPGTIFNCKADLLAWVVPAKKKFNIYLFKRAEFLAWLFQYIFERNKTIKLKTPGISPHARGIAIPIKLAKNSFSCLGEYEFKL